MQAEVPVGSLITTLQHCRRHKDLQLAERLLAYLLRHQHLLQLHPIIGNHLVPALVECGSLLEARRVFDRLSNRSEHSWTSLISGYISHGDPHHAFLLYHTMLQESPSQPGTYTYVPLLHACGKLQDAGACQGIHGDITRRGLETELYLGTTLVDAYFKCSMPIDARNVFSQLTARDTVTWTTLISGYAEVGLSQEVICCYKQMQSEKVFADTVTFLVTLKACATIGALEAGQEQHSELTKRGLERDLHAGSSLVDMYGKCGLLVDANQVFEGLSARDTVLWNTMISSFADHKLGREVLHCFEQMHMEGTYADSVTFTLTLKACTTREASGIGKRLHVRIRELGLETDPHVGHILVDVYCTCGLVAAGEKVFNLLPDRGIHVWNTLLAGYAECGLAKETEVCLQQMQVEGLTPDPVSYSCSLKACGNLETSGTGWTIHHEITKRALETELFVGSALVYMYDRCKLIAEAQQVFDKLPIRNAISWTALFTCYAQHGCDENILQCFREMQPESVYMDAVMFITCLKACGNIGNREVGMEIAAEITKRGLEREQCTGTALVDMFWKCSSLAEARCIFDNLPARNAVSWSTLISGYTEHGLDQEVLNCFERMSFEGVSADAVMFILCLKACGNIGALEKGREVHAHAKKSGLEKDPYVWNMLIDMYGKCGSVAEAREVFDELDGPDIVAWNTMIKTYGENHEGYMAIQCFEEMQEQGVKPNSITFTCLLTACSHASLILKGQEYFKVMTDIHRIKPDVDHFVCMVDLFARSGQVYEAGKFITAMQCPPTSETLVALLNACKIYGKVELGQSCFQQLVEMKQENASAYLLMAGIYVGGGWWNDAKRVEEMREYIGAKKKPGSALIEVNRKPHEFVVGLNHNEEMVETLEMLSSHMKGDGYVPILDMAVGQTSDQDKLAPPFSFIDTHSLLTGSKGNILYSKSNKCSSTLQPQLGLHANFATHSACL